MKRNLFTKLERLLEQFPAVGIIGARQVGKTTLAKQLRPNWQYIDCQKPSVIDRLLPDPEMFFKDNPHSVILDEAQDHPILFDVLRGVIDEIREQKGRFIITGSSSPDLLTRLSESLAGRIAIVELDTLKSNEIAEQPLSDFYQWFLNPLTELTKNTAIISTPPLKKNIFEQAWFYGGYPEVVLLNTAQQRQDWFEFYEKSYLYRDIARLFPHLDKQHFQRFFKALAHLSGTILNKSQLGRDLEISEASVRNYLSIAAGTFLWRLQSSFERTGYSSLLKMPKGHLTDSGLLHYLMGINNLTLLQAQPLLGRSFEGFIIEEIMKGLTAQSLGSWQAYHYRTRNNAEIDLILEGRFGLLPIEIKYGIRIEKKQLITLSQFIEKENLSLGLVINQSEKICWLTAHILQIPASFI